MHPLATTMHLPTHPLNVTGGQRVQILASSQHYSALTHSFEMEQNTGNLKLPARTRMIELRSYTDTSPTPPIILEGVKYFEIWLKFGLNWAFVAV